MLCALGTVLPGCALLLPTYDVPAPIVTPQLPPTPTHDPVPVVAEPVADPVPVIEEPVPVIEEPVPPHKVAIVLSSRVAAYENVAVELGSLLEDSEIYDLSDKSLTQKDAFDAINSGGIEVVVAVGLRAASFAKSITEMPVIVSQVFNVDNTNLNGGTLKVVTAIPPLELQLKAWREINPELNNIGAILGEGHESLIDEATQATNAHGMKFHHRLAKSDRETLYLFIRLVADIDGFWLFPDNRILSSTVLREMLVYAARHRVQVAVFNDSLLTLGAAISTTSVNKDIARTIVSVIDGVLGDGLDSVPEVTQLSEIRVRTNSALTQQVARDAAERSGAAH